MSGDYQVRVSTRARRLRLQIDGNGNLLITVPKGFDQRLLPRYLAVHQPWITRTRAKIMHQRTSAPELFEMRPQAIHLAALNRSWEVVYCATQTRLWRDLDGTLHIRDGDERQLRRGLCEWLNHHAKNYLPIRLQQVSKRLELPYSKLTIRAQKTRWGSCSAKKNINLNRNLLFLPEDWVDYLCVHELCHTRVLNHSTEYWCLVADYEPAFERLERQLTQAVHRVPLWARP